MNPNPQLTHVDCHATPEPELLNLPWRVSPVVAGLLVGSQQGQDFGLSLIVASTGFIDIASTLCGINDLDGIEKDIVCHFQVQFAAPHAVYDEHIIRFKRTVFHASGRNYETNWAKLIRCNQPTSDLLYTNLATSIRCSEVQADFGG